MPPKELTYGFIGHRPSSLPWGFNESDPRCIGLKAALLRETKLAYEKGARFFLSGMAEGADLYAAESVLLLKRQFDDIALISVFPYGCGANARQRRIALAADGVISLYPEYVTGCMLARDRFIVKHCSGMICVFSGNTKSGTAATMRMALDEGLGLIVLRV